MGTKLLLADDSITIQKVVGIIFANEDYDLTVVDNGTAALEKAQESVPDVILVDALMPDKNGYDVCSAIRADSRLRHIPLLLMTGAFEPFDEDKARQCGADDFITKPFESQQLIEKVKKLVELGYERAESPVEAAEETFALDEEEEAAEFATPGAVSWDAPIEEAVATFQPLPDAFDDVSKPAEEVEAPIVQSAPIIQDDYVVQVVDAAPEDDPWGVFELSTKDEEPVISGSVTLEPPQPPEADEVSFQPKDESSFAFEVPEPAPQSDDFKPKWTPVEEETFSFHEEEAPAPTVAESFTMTEHHEVSSSGGMVEPESFVDPGAFVQSMPHETAAFYEHGIGHAAPAAATGTSEEQLRLLLSQISREVIEKIVWEVVPDLAETLIKEEIRKIKAGAA